MYNKGSGKKAGKSSSKRSGFGVSAGGKAMAGKSGAAPAEPGKVSTGGRKGNNAFKADTGGGKMAGFSGSRPAKKC